MNSEQERTTPIGFGYEELMQELNRMEKDYPALSVGYLGKSIAGRGVPHLKLGHGRRQILYVGAHHGMEWITSILLCRFAEEFCQAYLEGRSVCRVSPHALTEAYTLHIIPMLNPDGVDYQLHGVKPENPLYERLLAMNGGSADFSRWQANGRGVDLNHNYDAGFAEYKRLELENGIGEGAPTRYSGPAPLSEPETAALANLINFCDNLSGILTLHTQGEEIFFRSHGQCARSAPVVAKRLSALTGYKLSESEGLASFGGLTDWCAQACDIPAFTLECGKGVNPLPISDAGQIYLGLRQALFVFPTLV